MERKDNVIIAKNLYRDNFKDNIMYVASSEKIGSFTGDKGFFIGDKTVREPEGLDKVSLDNESGLGKIGCVAIELEIGLEPYESKELVLMLGAENTIVNARNTAYKYSKISHSEEELNKVKKYWYGLVTKIQVNTPLESLNIILNGWAIYQTITSRLWSKTGYYQSRRSNRIPRPTSRYNWLKKYRYKLHEKTDYGSSEQTIY